MSYCVVIFPESPGSFAELGFFSKELHTKQKIFALKDYKYAGDDSYVNRLIDYIHEDRNIYTSILRFSSNGTKKKKIKKELKSEKFPEILKKIEADCTLGKTPLKKQTSYLRRKDYQILPLALLHELILIYPYLSYGELKVVYKHCLSNNFKRISFDKDEMNYILSLLVVSGYIKRVPTGTLYYFENIISDSFFEFDKDFNDEYEMLKNEISLDIRMEKGIDNDI